MANNVKENRAKEAFRKHKELLNQSNVDEQIELDTFKDNLELQIAHYNKRLDQLENDFNEKIAHLQKKFFDNSNHNIEVFAPIEEFIDDKDYTSIIENILSIDEVLWKEKTRYNLKITLKGSSRIYTIFILEKKYIPTEGCRITFRYNEEFNKLVNCRIVD